ncbi:MAG: acyl--CoA ligase [bacterium]|nr:acyl--CoA ligase [bacterium]
MQPMASVIDRLADSRPDDPAFLGVDDAFTWSDYARRSESFAAHLVALGIDPGERVGIVLPDGPGVHAAFVGCEKAGIVVVGIGPRAGTEEIAHLLALSGARALVARPSHRGTDMAAFAEKCGIAHFVPVAGQLEEDEPAPEGSRRPAIEERRLDVNDLFLLNSTSGTTGLPKCVTHHQARWHHFHELAVEAGEMTDADVFMSVLPAPFGFGLWTAHFTPTLLGAPTVLMERFDAGAMLTAIETHRVSVLAAVSTQFIMMLNAPELAEADLSSLRVLFTGGEAVPYERAAEFEERTGASVLQFYGSNETGALCRTTIRDSRDKRLRTAGRLIDSMQVRLYDDGGNEVTATGVGQPACRGPLTSRGYFGDEAANAKLYTRDGWMLTGDIARIDAEGYLSVIGRTADFIIRGGKNISGPAVEDAVSSHPSVALAAAVAMPDPVYGERVCVYLELLEGEPNLTLEALLEHLQERGVSKEWFPERLIVVDALPRASGGKIAKGELRADIRNRLGAGN